MVITIASMKGGVGKTTIAAMVARYISDKRGSTVVVIDLDPQRGATIILLGARKGASISPPTIYDILQSELANMPSTEIFAQAMQKSPYSDKIFVVPANGDLARILEEDTPPDLLRYALDESPLSKDVTIIVDTGSGHKLCEMSVAASDVVFIGNSMTKLGDGRLQFQSSVPVCVEEAHGPQVINDVAHQLTGCIEAYPPRNLFLAESLHCLREGSPPIANPRGTVLAGKLTQRKATSLNSLHRLTTPLMGCLLDYSNP